MKFPHTVSIFNKYTTDEGDIITKTLLNGVLFIKDENTNRLRLGLVAADSVSVYIPKNIKTEKHYIDYFAYVKLSEDELDEYYTFNNGDFVSFGDVDFGDLSINDFKNEYGNLYEITGVSDYDYGSLKHFVIVAR